MPEAIRTTPKRKYEKPVLCPLGEMVQGVGAACKGGGAPNASCMSGGIASRCNPGSGDV